ncbi:MAG: His/Gly/Thr/Pro-type tRNA ligase C-terminal domain-containing protein, partial [Abditibacteriales bacterium]|nr:His/Gly/Thr/Pro-type tRNA ligase C-terminal domain-containing protein [Abditibacteriales bacterium]MDW8365190.1 His/Gly/Thr/Pro-type tRNA ligase C-terminal domain-containing protein [Abditibacteriales bacterium]
HERPVMIHRAMLGSLERFMGILIEHCAGAFPTWLAPVQVAILPIADRHNDYAFKLASDLRNKNLRVTVNTDSAKTGAKVAVAEAQKIPYMLIVGDREVATESVSVRQRGRKDLGSMKVAEFTARILAEVATRAAP